MNINKILKEEINNEANLITKRSFFENVNNLLEDDSSYKYVYHGSNNTKHLPHDGMYFSETAEYARQIGGSHVAMALIRPQKPLYLEKYNKPVRDAGLETWGEDLFTIAHDFIRDNYKTAVGYIYSHGLKKEATDFMKELKECDSIFGADAGQDNTKVWYVKYKGLIQFI